MDIISAKNKWIDQFNLTKTLWKTKLNSLNSRDEIETKYI